MRGQRSLFAFPESLIPLNAVIWHPPLPDACS